MRGLRFGLVHPVNGKPDDVGLCAKAAGYQFVQLAAHGRGNANGNDFGLGLLRRGHGVILSCAKKKAPFRGPLALVPVNNVAQAATNDLPDIVGDRKSVV